MNTNLFKSFMVKNGDTQGDLAKALNLPQSAVSARINGRIEFKKNEINIIRKRYQLTDAETILIFFAD